MTQKQIRRSYSNEFKRNAVELSEHPGRQMNEVAEEVRDHRADSHALAARASPKRRVVLSGQRYEGENVARAKT